MSSLHSYTLLRLKMEVTTSERLCDKVPLCQTQCEFLTFRLANVSEQNNFEKHKFSGVSKCYPDNALIHHRRYLIGLKHTLSSIYMF